MTDSQKALIFVIEGNEKHRASISEALISFYRVQSFEIGSSVLDRMRGSVPNVIILHAAVRTSGQFSLLKVIRDTGFLKDVPVILTSSGGGESVFDEASLLGVSACFLKPFRRGSLLNTISQLLNETVERGWAAFEPVQREALIKTVKTFNEIADLIEKGAPLPYEAVRESCAPLMEAVQDNRYKDILKGIRGHDNYSYVHSLRVATFLSLFGHAIGVSGDELMILATGGLIHDVGKMAIPSAILNKTGPLLAEDWEMMRSHVAKGDAFLENSPGIPKGALSIAHQHHERMDGSGYPDGLENGELNDLARMSAIVDMFSGLTDRRVYKDSLPPEEALEHMSKMKGKLDQRLLGMFRETLLDSAVDMEVA